MHSRQPFSTGDDSSAVDAVESIDQLIESVDLEIRNLVARQNELLSHRLTLLSRRNTVAPVFALPPEVLGNIFALCAPTLAHPSLTFVADGEMLP